MEHIDPQELDGLALGEAQPTPLQNAHLDECARCRGELDAVRRTAGAVRSARDLAVNDAPDAVWAAVHAELGLSASLSATPRRGVLTDGATVTGAVTSDPSPIATDAQLTRRGAGGPSSPRRRRRPPARRWILPSIAAGVALVLGIGGGFGLSRVLQPTAGDVVATASLAALPDWPDASGTATVRELPDGTRQVDVEVDTDGDDDDAPLREVWLLSPDASGLVSIGFLDGSAGTFTVPAGVDLATYPIVDVSAEPQDGDPTHSGDSIVRGELGAS
ncbi:anti-sigma-K factor rskA [Labedella gwakjiensis]|uniref:Anti-sigma factor n=1 Tax=Labedella gwakjiensis TaxID=390269 RepID=A0A2P8GWN7_9MICO|nr:anti-sigma factor [Labedella gwakjiensis]PSL38381.1 anti-sigma-K factor rskA [Labedella gwakjiensis]RUQ87091.1 anti-sigma factor [Labedella gwakjiensis]